jgi:uncharacterized membrane protein (DUF2068 family)
MAKPRPSAGVALLARVNLVIYVLLCFWALSFVLAEVNLVALGLAGYSVVGVVCSSGLLRQKKWSLYLAVIMWIAEGVAVIAVSFLFIDLLSTDPVSIIIFLSVAVFRFATVAYLTRRKVKEAFNPKQKVTASADNQTLEPKNPEARAEILNSTLTVGDLSALQILSDSQRVCRWTTVKFGLLQYSWGFLWRTLRLNSDRHSIVQDA